MKSRHYLFDNVYFYFTGSVWGSFFIFSFSLSFPKKAWQRNFPGQERSSFASFLERKEDGIGLLLLFFQEKKKRATT
jgi:hypothetical protein